MTYMFKYCDDDTIFYVESEDVRAALIEAIDYVGEGDRIVNDAILKCENINDAVSLYNKIARNGSYTISSISTITSVWAQYEEGNR